MLFLFSPVLFASDFPPISHLGIDQGLSNNSVRAIYRDHNGFMWFGTYDGLNRYDGYEFKIFRNKLNDTTSLPHNYIYCITEDSQSNLWVGTGQGIGIYNNLTAKFLPAYYQPFGTTHKAKITVNVNVIKANKKGDVLIGTNGWGLIVQEKGKHFGVQIPVKNAGKQTTEYQVRTIFFDENGQVWLSVSGMGLYQYDDVRKTLRFVDGSVLNINAAVSDGQGSIWLGSGNGLFRYSLATKTISKTYNEEGGQLTSNNVTSLALDKDGELWIGTEGGGVDILKMRTATFRYLLPDERKSTLSSESVFSIFIDRDSRKWLGTLKGGVNLIDPFKNRFQTITHDPLNPNSLINDFVSSFYEDAEHNLWIGTDGGGLSYWNRKENSFLNFKHTPGNTASLSNNAVNSITGNDQGNIWVTTFGGGINRFNKATNSFQHYRCINTLTGAENKNAWLLLEDHEKQLWATTFSDGKPYRYNRATDRFDLFSTELTDLIALKEDRSEQLWAGNSHQLIKVDRTNKRHSFYEIGKPVRAIFEDAAGNFWIGAEGGGLILFDRNKGKIVSRFSDADGLCNNSVLNILEDKNGYLWLSTFNGLSQFDFKTKQFKNFYQSDGLQSNQFLYNSAIKLSSGELAFGGVKGFTIFRPESLLPSNTQAAVYLTELKVNNQPVSLGDRYITATNGDQIAALEIPYADAALSFGFAALEYSAPDKISYAYYLQGWDKGWNNAGRMRTANYTRLSEGTYLLRIKCTNTDGVWNSKEIAIRLVILPPWYRTWWAYAFYLLVIVAAIYVYLRYRTRQAKLAYEMQIVKLNAEKAQAEYEKTQAQYEREKAERETERVINEREKEINEKRLSFFTDMSHEFRTPLTLIINPIKDLLQKKEEEAEKKELHVVYRNARRLLSLVDQLLLFRKADTEADQLSIAKLDMVSVCKEVYLSFVQLAKTKRIAYDFDAPEKKIAIYADKEKVEIVLFNLLSNALKYTQEGGKVSLQVKENENTVDILITDNGPGIPNDVGEKLFDRFYRVASTKTARTGFGIGLYLAKHFIDKHKGNIRYESEVGKGTTFHLTLQKGTHHLDGQVVQTAEADQSELLQELVEEPIVKEEQNRLENLVSGQQSILIVDDDAQLRQYTAQLFKEKYIIYEAESGEEALQLAAQNTPDLVISDVSMKGMSGIELTKSIKEKPELSHIPVILLTGASAKETKLKGVELGADDYITKPFEKEFLIARVENILRNRNLLQNYFYNEITLQKNTLKVSAEYKEFLDNCIRIVEEHLDDDQFSIQTLASEIGMSHSTLYKRVKSISGQSVNAFIRFIRLRKAAELFITTDANVNQVSMEVGINDIKYFRSQFNKLFGMNPSEYIKKFRKPFNKNFTLSDKMVQQKKE
jgi:signal transduction histidine kinase/ligand-binding sensor domain-containing protein/DNA-binding response OmpR family regulator